MNFIICFSLVWSLGLLVSVARFFLPSTGLASLSDFNRLQSLCFHYSLSFSTRSMCLFSVFRFVRTAHYAIRRFRWMKSTITVIMKIRWTLSIDFRCRVEGMDGLGLEWAKCAVELFVIWWENWWWPMDELKIGKQERNGWMRKGKSDRKRRLWDSTTKKVRTLKLIMLNCCLFGIELCLVHSESKLKKSHNYLVLVQILGIIFSGKYQIIENHSSEIHHFVHENENKPNSALHWEENELNLLY